jgi:hypothetical protein
MAVFKFSRPIVATIALYLLSNHFILQSWVMLTGNLEVAQGVLLICHLVLFALLGKTAINYFFAWLKSRSELSGPVPAKRRQPAETILTNARRRRYRHSIGILRYIAATLARATIHKCLIRRIQNREVVRFARTACSTNEPKCDRDWAGERPAGFARG